jgi:hypothetical protein
MAREGWNCASQSVELAKSQLPNVDTAGGMVLPSGSAVKHMLQFDELPAQRNEVTL